MKNRSVSSKLRKFVQNKNGNFALLTAVAVPLLFLAGSLALDTTNAMSMKVRLQDAADSAALATATRLKEEKDLTVDEAKAFALKFIRGQVAEDFGAFDDLKVSPTVKIEPVVSDGNKAWQVSISMNGSQKVSPMAQALGKARLEVGVASESISGPPESQGSFSMALVLDRSGSMNWYRDGQKKMDVLKTAVGELIDQLEEADPNGKYVRLGASSYNNRLRGTRTMGWDLEKTRTFVQSLRPSGGTDSTDAFEWARWAVTHNREATQHRVRSGQVPKKFIVFMTDGDNTYRSDDRLTMALCDRAKAESKDGGVVVYTVAFAAPERGKQLLSYCASSQEHYFDAKNSSDLIDAFKTIGNEAANVVSRLTR